MANVKRPKADHLASKLSEWMTVSSCNPVRAGFGTSPTRSSSSHTYRCRVCPRGNHKPRLGEALGQTAGGVWCSRMGAMGHTCLKQPAVAMTRVKDGPGGCQYSTGNAQARLYSEQEQAESQGTQGEQPEGGTQAQGTRGGKAKIVTGWSCPLEEGLAVPPVGDQQGTTALYTLQFT